MFLACLLTCTLLLRLFGCIDLFCQLEKVYDPRNEEDDMVEMEEERLRMREHMMKNVSLPSRVLCRSVPECSHCVTLAVQAPIDRSGHCTPPNFDLIYLGR